MNNKSNNIIEPLVDSIINSSKLVFKSINKILGLNTIDFKKFFEEVGLCNKSKEYPKLYNISKEEYFIRYEFEVPIGINIDDFKKVDSKLAHLLGVEEKNMRITRNNFHININILTKQPTPVYDPEVHKMKNYEIPIGLDLDKMKLRYLDLSDSTNAHCYIAGTTRCGKSTLIRLMLTMCIQKSIADIQLSLINIKKVDLIEFRDCKNTVHYTEEEEDAKTILLQNFEEMQRRYTLFTRNKGIKNIWSYRNLIGKMPIRLIVIEELAGFEGDEDFHRLLRLIAQQGAGAGIFLILATQLPNKDVLPNLTKQNINVVIGGRCKDSIRSEIIIEDGELQKLKGKGHMKVFDADEFGTEVQTLWIDDDMVENIAQQNLKRSLKQNKRAIEAGTSITPGDNKNFCENLLSPKL